MVFVAIGPKSDPTSKQWKFRPKLNFPYNRAGFLMKIGYRLNVQIKCGVQPILGSLVTNLRGRGQKQPISPKLIFLWNRAVFWAKIGCQRQDTPESTQISPKRILNGPMYMLEHGNSDTPHTWLKQKEALKISPEAHFPIKQGSIFDENRLSALVSD